MELMQKEVFILSKEAYILDMIATHFETQEDNLIIDFDIPEHQEFVDFYMDKLLNNEHVIDYGRDTVFIVGLPLDLARSLIGRTVGSTYNTKQALTDMLIKRNNIKGTDYYDILESINLDREFKNKEDIEQWFIDQEELMNNIKISSYLDIAGQNK